MPLVRVGEVKTVVELCRIDGDQMNWDYTIPTSDLMVRRGLIRWISRLSKEEWISKEHIRQLIELSHILVNSSFRG